MTSKRQSKTNLQHWFPRALEARRLLKFATDVAEQGGSPDYAEIAMLKNIIASLWHICDPEIG
jgi:hypothetical protein